MKTGIHPVLNSVNLRCSCGNVIQTLSTLKDVSVSICSGCHPFFTGKQKILDTAGRIEKFNARFAKKEQATKKGPRTVTIK